MPTNQTISQRFADSLDSPVSEGTSMIPLNPVAPVYRMIGSRISIYAIRKMMLVRIAVVRSKRIYRYSGSVAMPLFRKRGRKNIAIATSARTAITSHAMTQSPYLNAEPLSPPICSVERLVRSSDPAMNG